MRVERKWFLAIGILLASLCLAAPVRAANVTVGCPGGSGGTYPSISAALAAIGVIGPSTITVTGTCNENVGLFNARSITIVAPVPGGAGAGGATIIGPQDSDVFDISNSQDITLQNLEIRGNAASSVGGGVAMDTNSQVRIRACNIHDNPDGGVLADSDTLVILNHTTLQNSSNGDGLDLTNDSSARVFFTTIQNNAGAGVFLQNRSSVLFVGQNSIQNNPGGFGIFAVDLSRVALGTGNPSLVTTIQGHSQNGIALARQSVLILNGPHSITGNGSACPTDPTCGGIFALRNSTMRATGGSTGVGPSISGNQSSGISLEQGVDIGLDATTVSNNTGDGVHIRRISIGQFITANTVTGNGGASVFCDTTSLVVGDLSTFTKVNCSQIERPLGPPRPGNPKEPNP